MNNGWFSQVVSHDLTDSYGVWGLVHPHYFREQSAAERPSPLLYPQVVVTGLIARKQPRFDPLDHRGQFGQELGPVVGGMERPRLGTGQVGPNEITSFK